MRLADAAALTEVLREAGRREVMPRFRRLGPDAVRAKTGRHDLVTEADEASERIIAAGLARHFPGALVVGEEGSAADPDLLGRLGGTDLAFVVDPIDGTANYAGGVPLFCVMAAAIVRGEIALAVIHDPISDDSAVALRGEGAWLEAADGSRADMRVADPLPAAAMSGGVSWRYLEQPLRSRLLAAQESVGQTFSLRCAAHEYRLCASGGCEFLVYGRMYPWDHAPGWLLHREAGGYSAQFDGRQYSPLERYGGLICAPDRAGFEELREVLLR